MQNLGNHRGICFVNDSKATTIESVKIAARGIYEQMDKKRKLFLLLGGKDKHLPWEELNGLSNIPKLVPIFFGEVGPLAKEKSKLDGDIVAKLRDAVSLVKRAAGLGDIVLLSPGGTSWDEFKNFEERGKAFEGYIKD